MPTPIIRTSPEDVNDHISAFIRIGSLESLSELVGPNTPLLQNTIDAVCMLEKRPENGRAVGSIKSSVRAMREVVANGEGEEIKAVYKRALNFLDPLAEALSSRVAPAQNR